MENKIENILDDLEKVNSDFKEDIEREKKKNQIDEKNEEEKEEEIDLKPLVDNNQLEDISNLNPDNISDYLKKNGKIIEEKKDIKKDIKSNEENKNITKIPTNILENFELNKELWSELNLEEEDMEKIKHRLKIEIKNFIRDNLIVYLQQITK